MKSVLKVSFAVAALAVIGCKDNKKSNKTSSSSSESSKATTYAFKISDKNPIKNYSLSVKGNFSKECEEDEEVKWHATSQLNEFSFNENGNKGCILSIDSIEFSNQDNKNEVYKIDNKFDINTDSINTETYYLKDENGKSKYKISTVGISGKNREFRIDEYNPQNNVVENLPVNSIENIIANEAVNLNENTLYSGSGNKIKLEQNGFSFNTVNRLLITKLDLVQTISYSGELEFSLENNYVIKSYSILNSTISAKNAYRKLVNSSNIKITASDLQFYTNLPLTYNKNENPSKLLDDLLKDLTIVLYLDNKEGKEIPFEFRLGN